MANEPRILGMRIYVVEPVPSWTDTWERWRAATRLTSTGSTEPQERRAAMKRARKKEGSR